MLLAGVQVFADVVSLAIVKLRRENIGFILLLAGRADSDLLIWEHIDRLLIEIHLINSWRATSRRRYRHGLLLAFEGLRHLLDEFDLSRREHICIKRHIPLLCHHVVSILDFAY